MTDNDLFNAVLIAIFLLAPVVFLSLLFSTAPYGRHNRRSPGPALPVRLAWVLMESPAVFAFGVFFFLGPHSGHPVPLLLLCMWAAHYVHRTLIYPFQMRVGRTKTMPASVASMGFVFNLANAYLNAGWIGTFGSYDTAWLADPRFVAGLLMFGAGYAINRHADSVLRRLRKPGETDYRIPRGGLYEWISCPNYFGELLTWCGWAVATWSLAGLSFAVFTAANLVPRAIANHRWYRSEFEHYPPQRRAVLPFIL